jgi:osmotically-inducible protein OsmY
VAPGDEQLLGDTVAALSSERDLNNMTVTIVAKNGELIINGKADVPQAARIERIARRVANGHVTAIFDTQAG